MGTRRSSGGRMSFMDAIKRAHESKAGEGVQFDVKSGKYIPKLSGSGGGLRGMMNVRAQAMLNKAGEGSSPEPQAQPEAQSDRGYGASFVEGAAKSNPALAQSLKISKQQAPETKKKKVSLAKPSVTPKKKAAGASPASAVAGGLGSSSGGSVRL